MYIAPQYLFDGSLFSASGSWAPIVGAEPLLIGIRHIGVKIGIPHCLDSPKLNSRLVWTRHRPRGQKKSRRWDAAHGVVVEKRPT